MTVPIVGFGGKVPSQRQRLVDAFRRVRILVKEGHPRHGVYGGVEHAILWHVRRECLRMVVLGDDADRHAPNQMPVRAPPPTHTTSASQQRGESQAESQQRASPPTHTRRAESQQRAFGLESHGRLMPTFKKNFCCVFLRLLAAYCSLRIAFLYTGRSSIGGPVMAHTANA